MLLGSFIGGTAVLAIMIVVALFSIAKVGALLVLAIQCLGAVKCSEAALIAIPALSMAMLISIAAFLYGDEKEQLYCFDKKVLFERVLLFRQAIITMILASFVLMMRWAGISAGVCIIILIEDLIILDRVYRWVCVYGESNYGMNYRQKLRIEFLQSLRSQDEIFELWKLVLVDKELNEKNQTGIARALTKNLDILKDGDDLKKTSLTNLLCDNIEKLQLYNPDALRALVEYAGRYYEERGKYEFGSGDVPPMAKRGLLRELLKNVLAEKGSTKFLAYVFFGKMGEILESYNGKEKAKYVKEFMLDIFYAMDDVDDVDIEDIWHNTWLKETVVTISKIENDDETALAVLKAYYSYLLDKLRWRNSDNVKLRLGRLPRLTEQVIPEIDSGMWLNVETLCRSAFVPLEGRDVFYSMLKSWCEDKSNLWYSSNFSGAVISGEVADLSMPITYVDKRRVTVYFIALANRWRDNHSEPQGFSTAINGLKKEYKQESKERIRLEIMESYINIILEVVEECGKIIYR